MKRLPPPIPLHNPVSPGHLFRAPYCSSLLNAPQVSVIPQPPQPGPHGPSNSPSVSHTSLPVCAATSTQMPRVCCQVPGPSKLLEKEAPSNCTAMCVRVCVHACRHARMPL